MTSSKINVHKQLHIKFMVIPQINGIIWDSLSINLFPLYKKLLYRKTINKLIRDFFYTGCRVLSIKVMEILIKRHDVSRLTIWIIYNVR